MEGTTSPEKTPTAPMHLAQPAKKSRREFPLQQEDSGLLVLFVIVFIMVRYKMI
jgi:hypothetical protein